MVISLMGTSFAVETSFATGAQPMNTRQYFKDMGVKMWKSGKGFGKVGALYAGTECVIESVRVHSGTPRGAFCLFGSRARGTDYSLRLIKYRAKNDITNAVAAGFVTGGILARNSGPTAALGGGLAFAAFSAAIDLFMRRETPE